MNKVAISALVGCAAALAVSGAYLGAPYVGYHIDPAMLMATAAVVAFGSAVAVLTLSALSKPEKKRPKKSRQLCDLAKEDYAHFPTGGLKIVLRPDSVIDEFDVVRNPKNYEKKDIFLIIKKSSGKSMFNPVLIKRLFVTLKDFENFLHILLVNEHDEYVGYIPAAYVRWNMVGGDAESKIVKYAIEVLADPKTNSIRLREINGLSMDEAVFDNETVAAALKKVSEGLFRGFVVFKNKRIRKPVGVIYEEDLVRLNIED
jgi:CBS domain-containing protein